jgi:hypothetical protein
MSNAISESTSRDAVARFNARLRLGRASQLACDGRLLEAEGILCLGGVTPDCPADLDLMARIRVRQARYEDARRFWRMAQRADGNRDHEECIQVLDQWLEYRHKLLVWRVKVAGWLILSIATFLALISYGFYFN